MIVLDLRGRSPVTEFFLIATGTSARQMRTVADELRDLGKREKFTAWQTSGYETAKWILVDFVHVVAHVFDPDSRAFYDLELLWGDCPRLDWRAALGLPPEEAALRSPEDLPLSERFREAAGEDLEEGREEDARLEGVLPEDSEGDADIDEDAEEDASVVVELPDESTGSNSVEFVEIDDPEKRRQRGKAVFPTTIEDEDEQDNIPAAKPVSMDSLDEDDEERAAEAAADQDLEAVSPEDLPEDRIESRPMGGVSAGLSSTTILEDDEEQQRQSPELDEAVHDHRDEVPPAQEAVDTEGADLTTRPAKRRLLTRKARTAPTRSAPTATNVKKAKAGVVKTKAKPVKHATTQRAAKTTRKPTTRATASKTAKVKVKVKAKIKAKATTKIHAKKGPAKKPPTKPATKKTRKPIARKKPTRAAPRKR